jgi:hypothetical protein
VYIWNKTKKFVAGKQNMTFYVGKQHGCTAADANRTGNKKMKTQVVLFKHNCFSSSELCLKIIAFSVVYHSRNIFWSRILNL